jgi:hypothetical protein
MKHTCVYSQTLGRVALLFAMAVFCARPSAGQMEVQIMVSGSWDYVEDPSPDKDPNQSGSSLDRIVLVSPQTTSHAAFIFSGDNATKFAPSGPGQPPSLTPLPGPGIYYLDVSNLTQGSGHKPQAGDLMPLNYSNLQPTPQPIRISTIKNILYTPNGGGMPRYAVSLPTPDYYTTYSGSWGGGGGFSESIVDVLPISNQLPSHFTTWMVLHYWINSTSASASLTAVLDNGHPVSTASYLFTIDPNSNAPPAKVPAISVVMAAVYGQNNPVCDSFSKDSFDHATSLWGLTRYAKFPEENLSGVQQPGVYAAGCPTFSGAAAGSADCHSPQMSVNGIVRNTP